MPSHLRLQSSFEGPIAAHATYRTSPTLPPAKKQKMSLTSTYYVASTARSKLGREAAKADHNLHRLVSHANLLDHLMVELQDAEREQEAWFNQSVRKASQPEERRVKFLDQVIMEEEEDSDSSDDEGEEEYEDLVFESHNIRQAPVAFSSTTDEDEELYEDQDSDEEELQLSRSPSRPEASATCPQLLEDDSDSDSEDEQPLSPEDSPLPLSHKQQKIIAATSYTDSKSQHMFEDFNMQHSQPLIRAC